MSCLLGPTSVPSKWARLLTPPQARLSTGAPSSHQQCPSHVQSEAHDGESKSNPISFRLSSVLILLLSRALKLCFTLALKSVLPCLRILLDTFSIFHQADHNSLGNRVKEVKKSSSLSCCCELDIALWMSELDHKEGWALKNWCFWTVVLEKTLESPLDCKEIKPVNPKENQPWIFIRGTDAEAEVLIFSYLMRRADLLEKDPDAAEDCGQEEKWVTEHEVVAWHHYLNGHEFEWALGDGEGQGSLACCSPWGGKESHTTEWLNNNEGPGLIRSPHPVRLGSLPISQKSVRFRPGIHWPCKLISRPNWLIPIHHTYCPAKKSNGFEFLTTLNKLRKLKHILMKYLPCVYTALLFRSTNAR